MMTKGAFCREKKKIKANKTLKRKRGILKKLQMCVQYSTCCSSELYGKRVEGNCFIANLEQPKNCGYKVFNHLIAINGPVDLLKTKKYIYIDSKFWRHCKSGRIERY